MAAVDEFLKARDTVLKELKISLQHAQNRMRSLADRHRRDVQFEVGDYVYIKLQPYQQTTVVFRENLKLSPQFYGPFRIEAKLGQVPYRLQLPPESRIHNVFHVSQLRKHLGDHPVTATSLPPATEDVPALPQPELVLDSRTIVKGKYRPREEVLVKWVGAAQDDATWEEIRRFTKSYPDFSLAVKRL